MKPGNRKRKFRIFLWGFAILLGFAAYEAISLQIKSIDRLYKKYDVHADYSYSFDNPGVTVFKVPIHGNRVQLPQTNTPWDTAFLKVRIESDFVGNLNEPFMEIASEGLIQRQYFERGASGARYLNLSNFAHIGGGNEISLSGHHIDLKSPEAELLLFRNDPVGDETILIVAPHPDDAEIAAFGLYSQKNVYIVTVTAGDAGEEYILRNRKYPDDARNSILKGRLRAWDSVATPIWGGVSPLHSVNLGYFDGMLKAMYENRSADIPHKSIRTTDLSVFRRYNSSDLISEKSKTSNWGNLVNDLAHILRKIQPKVIVTPHIYLDGHNDHQFSTIALFEALKIARLKSGKIYLYNNHHILTDYFPFGPAHSLISLPPWFDNSLKTRSVYSLGLSPDQQLEKLFALDAHHDLRPVPVINDYSFPWLIRKVKFLFLDFYGNYILHKDYSYLRRAIRSNELFFILTFEDIGAFEKEFLKHSAQPK